MTVDIQDLYRQLQERMPSLPEDAVFISCGTNKYAAEIQVPPLMETLFRYLRLSISWTQFTNPEVASGAINWEYIHRDGGRNGKRIADFWLRPDGSIDYREDAR